MGLQVKIEVEHQSDAWSMDKQLIACPWIGGIGVTVNKYFIERVGSDQIFVGDHREVGVLIGWDISDTMVELTIC